LKDTGRGEKINKTDFLPSRLLPFNIKFGKDPARGISDFDFSSSNRAKGPSATFEQDKCTG
jgi:hypothetical protein